MGLTRKALKGDKLAEAPRRSSETQRHKDKGASDAGRGRGSLQSAAQPVWLTCRAMQGGRLRSGIPE